MINDQEINPNIEEILKGLNMKDRRERERQEVVGGEGEGEGEGE